MYWPAFFNIFYPYKFKSEYHNQFSRQFRNGHEWLPFLKCEEYKSCLPKWKINPTKQNKLETFYSDIKHTIEVEIQQNFDSHTHKHTYAYAHTTKESRRIYSTQSKKTSTSLALFTCRSSLLFFIITYSYTIFTKSHVTPETKASKYDSKKMKKQK